MPAAFARAKSCGLFFRVLTALFAVLVRRRPLPMLQSTATGRFWNHPAPNVLSLPDTIISELLARSAFGEDGGRIVAGSTSMSRVLGLCTPKPLIIFLGSVLLPPLSPSNSGLELTSIHLIITRICIESLKFTIHYTPPPFLRHFLCRLNGKKKIEDTHYEKMPASYDLSEPRLLDL